MNTVPCPNGDGGICTIPDTTALLSEGRIDVVHREDVLAQHPRVEQMVDEARLVRVHAEPDEVTAALELAVGQVSEEGGTMSLSRAKSLREVSPRVALAVQTAFAAAPGSGGVLVNCSCKHVFVMPL